MKGKCYTAVLVSSLAILFASSRAYSSNLSNLSESAFSPCSDEGIITQPALQPDSDAVYTVRRGDSLIKIAQIFGTTPDAIKSANNLKGTKILIGQKLNIPVPRSLNPQIPSAADNEAIPASAQCFISSYSFGQADLSRIPDSDFQPRRLQLVQAGFKMLGVKYRWSGGSEKSGFDCSGLVKNLFAKFNIDLPHSSREQYKQGEKVDRDKLEVGDLVFFASGGKLPNHVGIYVGDNKFLHAARKARRVIISDLNKLWYDVRYLGARRVMDLWWDEPNPAEFQNN